ncbi:MAG: hypothetical protein LBR43_03745 [Spiroplasmataceae bacterium]|nr:hypothetical protein [Spiroplasmataceae bacterium]
MLFVIFFLLYQSQLIWITKLKSVTNFLILTFFWALAGLICGAIIYILLANKGKIILDNNQTFLDFCAKSNGLLFFGSIGSGKTALLAMLAQELPGDNKYATFPCNLPWMHKSQIDFSVAPERPLGVTETIFIDEGNLLFQGNIVQDIRERQRFTMHFVALSRQQGARIFANYQRIGQAPIQMREVVTGMFQVELLQKTDQGIYVHLVRWEGVAWTTNKTDQEFTVFISKKYLDTYNSYWLKSLKYIRDKQGYV